jgi:hypothetical protein
MYNIFFFIVTLLTLFELHFLVVLVYREETNYSCYSKSPFSSSLIKRYQKTIHRPRRIDKNGLTSITIPKIFFSSTSPLHHQQQPHNRSHNHIRSRVHHLGPHHFVFPLCILLDNLFLFNHSLLGLTHLHCQEEPHSPLPPRLPTSSRGTLCATTTSSLSSHPLTRGAQTVITGGYWQ